MSQPLPPPSLQPPPHALQPPPMPAQPLGYASPMTGVASVAWRRGSELVTPREVDLGDACVKCGAPTDGWRWRKTLYWISPVFILVIFVPLGLLILLILYLVLRKSAKVSAGLCPAHRRRRNNGLVITTLLSVIGVTAVFGGIFMSAESRSSDPPYGVLIVIGGLAMLLVAAATGTTMARVLSPKKIDDRYAWLRGAGEGYLQTLNTIP